ncbi:hypothetical protein FSP39_009636 [Pinctada imbricata]|uniref:G-protein coupled receptors family 1 profile domain-containing protein n=1 Tax=Pinctada imbricata TaxID=66713 RepID=A0AA89BVB2_PINIB|nr:hypothetical protein FSP39_009636 [Pinctada imbricata]
MAANTTEKYISLEELNNVVAASRVASTVILCILLVMGVTGNSVVLAVYGLIIRKSEERFFIPFLAFFDLCAVLAGAIFAIMQNMYRVAFPSLTLCKLSFFFTFVTTTISACLLLVVAINRYLKICRPQWTQMNPKKKKLSLLIVIVFAVSLSSPLFYFLDDYQHKLTYKSYEILIRTCELSPTTSMLSVNRRHKLAYYGVLFSLIVLNLVMTVFLYIPIGKEIFIRFRSVRKLRIQSNQIIENLENREEQNETSGNIPADDSSTESDYENSNQQNDCKVDLEFGDKSAEDNKEKVKASVVLALSNTSTTRRKNKRRRRVRNNFTIMFMTIVVFYVLSYIPTFVLMLTPGRLENWISLPEGQMNLLLVLRRFFLLNHVVNPFIYGYFDLTFRHKFKDCFKCLQKKL